MSSLDRRLNAYRSDLADISLKGKVDADRFVTPEPAQVSAPNAFLHQKPDSSAPLDSELLYGEVVNVLERQDGWAWVQSTVDGYVGYIRDSTIRNEIFPPTHLVHVLRTFAYQGPHIKAPARYHLSMNAFVSVIQSQGEFAQVADGSWVLARHITPIGGCSADIMQTAYRFLDTPYLWGGRTSLGLDCSALIQHAYMQAGIAVPRDTDMQEKSDAIGKLLAPDTPLLKGDVIFWKGHIAFVWDQTQVLHATGHAMLCVIEPRSDVDARARDESGHGITAIRRLSLQ